MLRAGRFACYALVLLTGCAGAGGGGSEGDPALPSGSAPGDTTAPGAGTAQGETSPGDDGSLFGGVYPSCDPTRLVRAESPALLVTDPRVLASFTLERVMEQLNRLGGSDAVPAEAVLQRLFDMENTTAEGAFADVVHCDDPAYGPMGVKAPVDCPRAEGALAWSKGLFEPGHADYFAPVAIVNRADLALSDYSTCGEYRVIFAKQSGKSDPANRAFLIFEGVLPNPQPDSVAPCWSIVDLLAKLDGKAPDNLARELERLYFTGFGPFEPVIHPGHFDGTGRVRLSERMQDPWRLREVRLVPRSSGSLGLGFAPSRLGANPSPEMFDRDNMTLEAQALRQSFAVSATQFLGAPRLIDIRFPDGAYEPFFGNEGESAHGGDAQPSYRARATGQIVAGRRGSRDARPALSAIDGVLEHTSLGAGCPDGDPLTAEHILNRATTQSCAGCHAPRRFLGQSRSIGCGLTWPDSLGGAHIDETGARSPALTDLFLPHRAEVLSTWVQACDWPAIAAMLQASPPKGGEGLPD